jgi:6-phosphogluconolactonase
MEIRNVIPGSAPPSFDLVLLGMGKDGHTASLFPGTRWDADKLVIASEVPQTGARRISMTPRIFNKAHAGLFLVAGLDKSQVLAEVLKNPASGLPAAAIRPEGSLTWMIDEAASNLIRD